MYPLPRLETLGQKLKARLVEATPSDNRDALPRAVNDALELGAEEILVVGRDPTNIPVPGRSQIRDE